MGNQEREPKFLTIKETIRQTTLSRTTIARYLKEGKIPSVKYGSRRLISASFVEGLKEQANKSTEANNEQ